MSLLDDLGDAIENAYDVAAQTDGPRAGITVEGDQQYLTTKGRAEPAVDWTDQLAEWGLNANEWTIVGSPRISVWEVQVKGGEVRKMHAWRARISRISELDGGPDSIVRQAKPVSFKLPTREMDQLEMPGWRTAVIMPDAQRPFEDKAAVDVALQILEAVEHHQGVDDIIHLGDDLDLPDFGKHRSAPDVCGKLNEAIESQYRVLALERALCPSARITWLAGNHDQRVTNWLVDNAPQLLGLQRPGLEEQPPVLSVPFLCRLDELEVDYLGPYPEGELWLNDHLRCIHGTKAKGQLGSTAAAYLNAGTASTIYGHIHRAELLWQTRHTRNGPRTFLAGSPGSLCDLNGAVPSAMSGINDRGQQGRMRSESWQNGIWVVTYEPEGRQRFTVDPIQIWSGWAQFRGETFFARSDSKVESDD